MKMKIIYRSSVIWNLILFMLLSFMFIYLQKAIYLERSAFNILFLKSTLVENLPVISCIFLSSLLIYNLKKICQFFYFLSVLFITSVSIINLFQEFSKLILIVLFLYILISYYFFFLLRSDLFRSYYNPLYNKKNLFEPMLFKIPCELEVFRNDKTESIKGYLTNWDDFGCFIALEQPYPKNLGIKNNLSIIFNEQRFDEQVSVVSLLKSRRGIGLRFKNNKSKNIFNWKELNKIIDDMGISVEYVK